MRIIILNLFFLFILGSIYGQINTDSLFETSIYHAKIKDYDLALLEAKKILIIHPERIDVMLHVINIYGWKKRFDSAKVYIEKAYNLSPKTTDLYDSWLNILLWNSEYEEIHKVASIAQLNNYHNKYNLALKKLIAYEETGKYDEGISFSKCLEKEILNQSQIQTICINLYTQSKKKQFSIYYSNNFFDKINLKSQHLAFIDFALKLKKNTLIFRCNYAQRFSKENLQFEMDYYHLFDKRKYIYSNYGVAFNNVLFPIHRAGLEYFYPFIGSFETSFGFRLLLFENSSVYITTGHISKYFGKSWLAIRPFYVFTDNRNSLSIMTSYRHYSDHPINYWGIEIGYGNSPDDRYVFSELRNIYRLNAYKIKAEKNILLNMSSELKISFGLSYEELAENEFFKRYILEFLFRHRF